MSRLLQACALALLAGSFLVSSGSAHIVLDACIGGVGLWDASPEVHRQWGQPARVTRTGPDVRWHYRNGTVLMTPWAGTARTTLIVLAITTTDPAERTVAGIGPGSALRAVRAAYPGRGCTRNGTCEVGRRSNRSTTLLLRRGRVVEVSISLYSDFDDGRRQRPSPRCR